METVTPDKINVTRFNCYRDTSGVFQGVSIAFTENGQKIFEHYAAVKDMADEWDVMATIQEAETAVGAHGMQTYPPHICLCFDDSLRRIYDEAHITMLANALKKCMWPNGGIGLKRQPFSLAPSFGEEG